MNLNTSRRGFLGGMAALAAGALPGVAPAQRRPGPALVRVSHDAFTVHAEPLVAVNPRDPANLLAAGQAWTATEQTIATYVSFDAGWTWRGNGPLPMSAGVQRAWDVTVAFDEAGRGFVCGTTLFGNGETERAVQVWRTEDGGRSFDAAVPIVNGQAEDHPWLAAGRHLYAVWCAQGLTALGFARSIDGGRTFEAPRTIAAPGAVAQAMGAAAADGLVAAAYHAQAKGAAPAPPGPPGGQPEDVTDVQVVCSRDGGDAFDAPVSLGRGAAELVVPGVPANLPSGPAVATGRRGGPLHVAWVTHQLGAPASEIVLATSPDGGRTWHGPTPVTPAGDGRLWFQPQLAVDEGGRVGVSAFVLGPGGVDVVLLLSEPRRLRFGPPLTLTPSPFDPARGAASGKHGAWWIGDYQGLAAGPLTFHTLWNDTRTGNLELFTTTVRY